MERKILKQRNKNNEDEKAKQKWIRIEQNNPSWQDLQLPPLM